MNKKNYCFYVVMAFLFAFPPWQASAYEESRKKTSEVTIDEVIVTADKREQKAKDIPTSMSVFSGLQLEDGGIEDVQEMILFTPNIHMKSGIAAKSINIRGISNDADYIHSPVGVFVDGINYSMNMMQDVALYDVERVEILRGPQGTLYGKNTESGVINIITRQPDNNFRGSVYTDIGAYQPDHGSVMTYKGGFSFSGPIVRDRFFIGLAGEYEKSDGFRKNVYNGDEDFSRVDRKNVRLTTRWTPSKDLEVTTNADVLEVNNGLTGIRYLEGPFAVDYHEVNNSNSKNETIHDGDGQSVKVKYQADNFDITSITGRRFHKGHVYNDGNSSPIEDGMNDIYYISDLLSQELRFSSNKESRFKWVSGIYVYNEDYDSYVDLPTMYEIRDAEVESHGYAIFGQGTYSVTKKLHITAGLRYGYDKQDGTLDYDGMNFITGMRNAYSFSKEFDDDVLLPKLSVSYDVTPKVMTYVTAARGYYGGGYNTSYAYSSEDFAYGPEYTWNYEAGFKSSMLGDRLSVNFAAFYIDIKDKQVAQFNDVSHMMVVRNAAEAHSQGFEIEVHAKPAAGFDIFGGFGYTEIVFDDWEALDYMGTVPYDYKDNEMPNAPKHTYNIGAQYRHPKGLFSRVDVSTSDSYYSDAKNTQEIDGVTLVNLRFGYEGERYDIIFWGKNITDEEYITMGYPQVADKATDGPPRTIGTTLRWRF